MLKYSQILVPVFSSPLIRLLQGVKAIAGVDAKIARACCMNIAKTPYFIVLSGKKCASSTIRISPPFPRAA